MPKGKKAGKKGKKGKKDGKKTKKAESFTAIVAANEKVWEARLDKTDRAKDEYRENAKRLLLENEELQVQLMTTERDTIDVISFLKKQDQEKESQLERFQVQVQEMQSSHRLEKDSIVQQFSKQISDLEDRLGEKMREVEIMQSELKMVKEFRRKRGLMQKELDEIKESMHSATREHKATLSNMESKFFEEKMRLQQEANQKIAELAEKAHTEAIANLDESTKSVYKENVRLTEALNYHMKEEDLLKKERERLSEENEVLSEEKVGDNAAVQEKVVQAKMQKELVTELENKVKTLEKSLSHVVSEFETERGLILENADIEAEAARIELVKLQRVMEMKTKEMARVKRLARNILDQRTPLERQCIDAMDTVKQEILAERFAQQKAVFEHKMVTDGSQTGNQAASADKAHKRGGQLYGVSGKVDIGDLTWEQRERVLRYLFNSINSTAKPPPAQEPFRNTSLPPLDTETEGYDDSHTFLTQAHLDVDLGEAQTQ